MLPALIDDQGKLWPAHSAGLSNAVGCDHRRGPLARHVVKANGFIHLERHGPAVGIEFHLDSVSPLALIGLLYWLHDNPDCTVILKAIDRQRPPQLFRDRNQIVSELGRMLQGAPARPRRTAARFASTRVAIEQSPFASRWSAARAIMELGAREITTGEMLGHLFDGMFVVSEFDAGIGEFRIRQMGPAHGRFDASFCAAARGKTFADVHDHEFGRWVADAQNRIRDTTEPLAERVDAAVLLPHRPRERFVYTRLMLPVRTPAGVQLIVSASTFVD